MKLTNVFKEKKKSNKRNPKNIVEVDSEEEKFKELESHQIKNNKIKILYPKPRPKKIQKTLDDLKYGNNNKGNESKSTQAFSKKIDNIFNSSKKADIVMKEDNNKKEELLELSDETKRIMNLIYNKKREGKHQRSKII